MPSQTAQQVCEAFLHEQIRQNEALQIQSSDTKVAQHLLARGLELRPIYEEIGRTLGFQGVAWEVFLKYCMLATGAHWTPEKNKADRDSRRRLTKVNASIAKLADQLADLLNERDTIHNRGPFTSDTLYHPVDVIDRASRHNGRYQSYLKNELENLCRFDLKYWPSLSKMARVIGEDAANTKIEATDPRTEVMSQSMRPSKADFIRAIQEGIAENQRSGMGGLPASFQLSDDSVATLANVLLDLPSEGIKDSKYVKNIRQRDRKRS
ncbi:hypothetical protein VDF13_18270 [Xanthomonas campestris pv. raphani]|uniref:hypothetical protein n=1 Tax=Xanthomonas campestris TaxID=339 RepID=UPI00177C7CE1|nr:hypothetical protein [Xanthomonas campestris]MCC8485784.1 hypothetical protein [Xanthomonas campestris]MDM7868219.1 hypothetical protein [Xanthomonas campestris pv. campestris]MEA9652045.1 hypothetical protein [Xanthomonas campestris pv. raphani]MEA9745196.1 hypothetical protein [Xanthomonas campestris pv. raphani]MEA9769226.1 hypothetical protein [Xanthomonas campestris pv. raphani]